MSLILSGTIEDVSNGGFELGAFTGWTIGSPFGVSYYPSITTAQKHSGTYAVDMTTGFGCYIEQTFVGVPVDTISSISYWRRGKWDACFGGTVNTVVITYSDATTTTVVSTTTEALHEQWYEIDLLSYLDAGKTITAIRIYSDSGSGYTWVDDVSIITEGFSIIGWEEEQSCDIAIRDIPLRDAGSHVDEGTWIIHPRKVRVTVRLTNAQKAIFTTHFVAHQVFTLYSNDGSGLWTYTGWFEGFPVIYEYSKKSSTEERLWKADFTFVIETISFAGSAYSESTATIVLGGNNFNPVIDAGSTVTNNVAQDDDYVNSDVDLDGNVWNITPLNLDYTIRTSSAGKYILDQMIAAHTLVTLVDSTSGINHSVWLAVVNERWEGDINWNKPWAIEIKLIYSP